MTEKEDETEPLSGEEALALARDGKKAWKAWNAWAKKYEGRAVNFKNVDFTTEENNAISFDHFIFPGEVDFSEAKFQVARFYGAIFKGPAKFKKATFEGDAWFTQATFEGPIWFDDGVTFKRRAEFGGGTFTGPVSLVNSRFSTVPDFRRTDFQKHVTLYGIEVDSKYGIEVDSKYATEPQDADKYRRLKEQDADKYRRLKELAVDARDHDQAQNFFACELKAKRPHETRRLAWVLNYLYELTSDFGRSLALPVFFLVLTGFFFGLAYAAGFGKTGMGITGLLYSAYHLPPFLPGSRNRLEELEARLFEGSVPDTVSALTMMEGVLGIVFIFLIGLALRNKFRI